LNEQWGLRFAFADMPATEAVRTGDESPAGELKRLPSAISWHTAAYFDVLDDSWRVIYSAEGRPVIIERPLGNGSLVLAADSYFMSNEALRSERQSELLAWMVGRNPTIVFDETHLGIRKHPGLLSLIKKHRLHWLIFAFAILALLFIWKNSVYFVPPSKKRIYPSGQNVYAGQDSTEGLVSLLRRNIPAGQLLYTCAREWRRAFQRNGQYSSGKNDPSQSLYAKLKACAAQSKDPVAGYLQMSKIILRGRHNE
jgi:hypothetical protein